MSEAQATTEGPKGRALRDMGVPVYKLADYDALDGFLSERGVPHHRAGANLSLLGRVILWAEGKLPKSAAEQVLDALRIHFKNQGKTPAEMRLYDGIKIALDELRGPEIVMPEGAGSVGKSPLSDDTMANG